MAAKVYFSREITPEKVLELYKMAGKELTGNVAIKLHSGEEGNQNFLKPDFWKPVIDFVGGTVVECNTAYEGQRNTTEKHKALLTRHGWDAYFKPHGRRRSGYGTGNPQRQTDSEKLCRQASCGL